MVVKERQKSEFPIFFLHILKTAGTSITAAIAEYFPKQDRIFREITPEVLQEYSRCPLGRVFVAGHWAHHSARFLPPQALTFTVLRDPRNQTISNYLRLCREDLSEINAEARDLGFCRFLREYPYYLVFQTGSLLVTRIASLLDVDEVVERIDEVVNFLGCLDFVGCVEQPDDLALCLPAVLGLPEPLMLRRLNRAIDYGASEEMIVALRQAYDELCRDPEVRRFVDIENRVYETALALTRQREGFLDDIRQAASAAQGVANTWPSRRFEAADPAIRTEVGEKTDGLLRLRSGVGYGLFGPYVDLPMGRLTVAIRLRGPRRGRVTMDIAAEAGETVLVASAIDLDSVEGDMLELSTELSRPFWQCEARLLCAGDVHADIAGVEFRFT
jgi:hypothetical protein